MDQLEFVAGEHLSSTSATGIVWWIPDWVRVDGLKSRTEFKLINHLESS